MIRSLGSLFKRLGGLFVYLMLLLLRSPVDAVLCVINALFLKGVFQAIGTGELQILYSHCFIYGLANFCVYFYNGIVWSKFASFSAGLVGNLRGDVFATMFRMPLEKVEGKGDSAWFTRLSSDIKMTLNLLTGALNIPHVILATTRIMVASVLLYFISPKMLLVELLILLPHLLLRLKAVVEPTEALTVMAQEKVEEGNCYLTAIVECADTIQMYGAETFLREKYEKTSLEMTKLRIKMSFRKAFGEFLIPLLGRGGYLLLFFLGCEMIQTKVMDFGEWTAAIQYRGAMLAASMMLLRSLLEVKKNAVGLKRMEEIYGACEE